MRAYSEHTTMLQVYSTLSNNVLLKFDTFVEVLIIDNAEKSLKVLDWLAIPSVGFGFLFQFFYFSVFFDNVQILVCLCMVLMLFIRGYSF